VDNNALIAKPIDKPRTISCIIPLSIDAILNTMIDAIKKIIHRRFPTAGILEPNSVTVPRIRGVSKIALAVVITASDFRKSANFPILIVGAKLLKLLEMIMLKQDC